MPEQRGVDKDPEDYLPAKGFVSRVTAPDVETPEGAATRMVLEMVKGRGPSVQLAKHLGQCWRAFILAATREP